MRKTLGSFVQQSGSSVRLLGIIIGISMGILLWGSITHSEELSPENIVLKYYSALKNGHFEQAYDYLSKRMTGEKTKKQWSEEMKALFETGGVVILDFSVSSTEVDGDKATVKVRNESRDIFNPDGIVEHETDYLIKDKEGWKIDETVVMHEE